jgi:hypothetical protein
VGPTCAHFLPCRKPGTTTADRSHPVVPEVPARPPLQDATGGPPSATVPKALDACHAQQTEGVTSSARTCQPLGHGWLDLVEVLSRVQPVVPRDRHRILSCREHGQTLAHVPGKYRYSSASLLFHRSHREQANSTACCLGNNCWKEKRASLLTSSRVLSSGPNLLLSACRCSTQVAIPMIPRGTLKR